MFNWLSKAHREKKRKTLEEAKLKEVLAEKVSKYEAHTESQGHDYTEITIEGEKTIVQKEHITIHDV